MLLTFPEMIWELTFGIYLIAKGFTSAARRQNAVAARGPHRRSPRLMPCPGRRRGRVAT